eukprot:1839279-Rhodomonas_salina.1
MLLPGAKEPQNYLASVKFAVLAPAHPAFVPDDSFSPPTRTQNKTEMRVITALRLFARVTLDVFFSSYLRLRAEMMFSFLHI